MMIAIFLWSIGLGYVLPALLLGSFISVHKSSNVSTQKANWIAVFAPIINIVGLILAIKWKFGQQSKNDWF